MHRRPSGQYAAGGVRRASASPTARLTRAQSVDVSRSRRRRTRRARTDPSAGQARAEPGPIVDTSFVSAPAARRAGRGAPGTTGEGSSAPGRDGAGLLERPGLATPGRRQGACSDPAMLRGSGPAVRPCARAGETVGRRAPTAAFEKLVTDGAVSDVAGHSGTSRQRPATHPGSSARRPGAASRDLRAGHAPLAATGERSLGPRCGHRPWQASLSADHHDHGADVSGLTRWSDGTRRRWRWRHREAGDEVLSGMVVFATNPDRVVRSRPWRLPRWRPTRRPRANANCCLDLME